jgi:hypothetical protein
VRRSEWLFRVKSGSRNVSRRTTAPRCITDILESQPDCSDALCGTAFARAGRVPSSVSEATSRLQRLIDTRLQLAQYVQEQAKQELIQKGYRVTPDSTAAGALLQLTVIHAVSAATGRNDERGLAKTVNAEFVRAADGKRLVFAIANQVRESDRALIRMASYADWLSNDELVVEQYRVGSKSLIARALEGL